MKIFLPDGKLIKALDELEEDLKYVCTGAEGLKKDLRMFSTQFLILIQFMFIWCITHHPSYRHHPLSLVPISLSNPSALEKEEVPAPSPVKVEKKGPVVSAYSQAGVRKYLCTVNDLWIE